jgi:hypothetical protein
MNSNNKYAANGVFITPALPASGEKVKLVYDGLLAKCGATEVYAHVGFGNNWENTNDYKMNKTSNGFEATIPIHTSKPLNICFRDSAYNWDNNSGRNYSFNTI